MPAACSFEIPSLLSIIRLGMELPFLSRAPPKALHSPAVEGHDVRLRAPARQRSTLGHRLTVTIVARSSRRSVSSIAFQCAWTSRSECGCGQWIVYFHAYSGTVTKHVVRRAGNVGDHE